MKRLAVTQIANATAISAGPVNYTFDATHHRVEAVQAVWTVTTGSYTLTLQYSLDGSTWENFATGTAITANGNVMWNVVGTKDGLQWRANLARTSGDISTLKIYVGYTERAG